MNKAVIFNLIPSSDSFFINSPVNIFFVLVTGILTKTLSPQEDYLLVVESAKQAVWKYHLAGENEGQKEFFSKMPGIPDNITPSGGDGYFI